MWAKKKFKEFRQKISKNQREEDGHGIQDHQSTPIVEVVSRRPATRDLSSSFDQEVEDGSQLSMIFHLSKSGCWRTVLSRCESHPEEASCLYQDPATGNTMLHYVAYNRGPAEVAKRMTQINPHLARSWNKNGSLPLHVACSYSTSPELIDALIEAYPEAARKTNHHRHFFSASVDSFVRGYSPIHILCETGRCNIQIFEKVVVAGIVTINQKDPYYGRTPLASWNSRKNLRLDQNRRNHMRQIVHLLSNQKDAQENSSINTTNESRLPQQMRYDMELYRTADFWQVASLLIVASFEKERFMLPITPGRVVRAAVGNQDCPASLTEYAILVHHEFLMGRDEKNGQTQLHVACSSNHIMTSVILDVLHACPKACQVRDKHGCFPLWYAVQRTDPSWAFRLVDWLHANPLAATELPAYHDYLLPHILHCLRYHPSHVFELLRTCPPASEPHQKD